MDTDNEELLALAEELMQAEGLPLAVALDAAALVLDAVADCAASWDRMARAARGRAGRLRRGLGCRVRQVAGRGIVERRTKDVQRRTMKYIDLTSALYSVTWASLQDCARRRWRASVARSGMR
jgi:hypothetical protein